MTNYKPIIMVLKKLSQIMKFRKKDLGKRKVVITATATGLKPTIT